MANIGAVLVFCILSFGWSSAVQKSDFAVREAELVSKVRQLLKEDATFAAEFRRMFQIPVQTPLKDFPCQLINASSTVPTSVHQLRPSDVQVVAAIGDSITAGRGAIGGLLGLLIDYRGLSWSIGGDQDYSRNPTLPNILFEYNKALYGYSQGVGSFLSKFNVAESGAKSRDILEQAEELVSRLVADKTIDYYKDWKVITLFIGANDLCDWCFDEDEFSVQRYAFNLQQALDYLHERVPRAFVNLVQVSNIELIQELSKNIVCKGLHIYLCDCAAFPPNEKTEERLVETRKGYQQAALDLVASGRYDTREDFTVVVQPFFKNTTLPRTSEGEVDFSYFASDCFHLSKKGQGAAAEALWNNMVERVGSKRESWTPDEAIECPTEESPYLYTDKNSKL